MWNRRLCMSDVEKGQSLLSALENLRDKVSLDGG